MTIDELAGVVDNPRARPRNQIVEEAVIRIVVLVGSQSIHIVASIGQLEIRDAACDRSTCLIPFVGAELREEMSGLEFTDLGIVGLEAAVPRRLLRHDRGSDGPVIVKIDAQLRPRADGVDVIQVLAKRGLVGLGNAGTAEGACAEHIVDVAADPLVPADDAQRDAILDERNVT